ncbi:MAG: CAP domain-containing protein [Candidatus Uhrbacteria bacterium]
MFASRKAIRCIGGVCRNSFIPHAGNSYRPYALHPRRVAGYSASALAVKFIILGFVVALPSGIFASPEANDARERAIITATNESRATNNTHALEPDARLTSSATHKTADMLERGYFAHTTPDGHGPEYFIRAAGYPFVVAGENLAMGFAEPRAVIEAWAASPTHRRNLVDPEFDDVGVGITVGSYGGEPTVLIAQHFGRERNGGSGTAVVSTKNNKSTAPTAKPTPTSITTKVNAPAQMAVTDASVAWETANNGVATNISAHATATGNIESAAIEVRGYDMALEREENGAFAGSMTIPIRPDDLFRVTTLPTLTVEDADGEIISGAIPWFAPKVVKPTIAQRYAQAKALLPETFGPLLQMSRAIYIFAFIAFALAWILNLLIEIRRQHLDLIVPGGALVLLLGLLVLT